VGVVVSAVKDAWKREFPYCMALGIPNLLLWCVARVAKLFKASEAYIVWWQTVAAVVLSVVMVLAMGLAAWQLQISSAG
jgi:hypothetical protein